MRPLHLPHFPRPSTLLSACILSLCLCTPGAAQQSPTASQITPFDYGAIHNDASVDESGALKVAIAAALASGLPLDLAGGRWRIDSTLEALGDLHIRNGSIHTSIESDFGLAIRPATPSGYVSPTIENVNFYKIQKQNIVGLWINRGHHVRMSNVNFTNFRNGDRSTALVLEQVQVLSWIGGFLTENERHMAVYGETSTDLKIYGVWFQDSRSTWHAGVTLEDTAGVTFTCCSFDIARHRPLVSLRDSKNISFVDTRFEKPSYPGGNVLPEVSYPAIELNADSVNIRFTRNYFSITEVGQDGTTQAEVVRIDAQAGGNVVLIDNTFPTGSTPITQGAMASLQYRAWLNNGLIDH